MNTEPYVKPVSISNSRFATWDRRTLEKLAEEAIDEVTALREELATALAGWRRAVTAATVTPSSETVRSVG